MIALTIFGWFFLGILAAGVSALLWITGKAE